MTRVPLLNQSFAFLLGFGLTFLPAYGPFLGILFIFSSRWSLRKADFLWFGATLLLTIPLVVQGGVTGLLFGLLQGVAPWFVYRTFRSLQADTHLTSPPLRTGLIVGLAAIVLLGWLQIDQLAFSYKTIAQAIVWENNPSLYGHSVLVVGLLMAILLPTPRLRLFSLGLSALGILVSGSREAAIAWVAVAVLLLFVGQRRSLRHRFAELGLIAVMLAIAAGLGPLLGWGRVGFLVDVIPAPEGIKNMVQGSEIARGDWWDDTWVEVESGQAVIGGRELTTYHVTKEGAEGWLRLQQVIPISANTPYTVSVWLNSEQASEPGIQGWGQLADEQGTFSVTAALTAQGWQAGESGPGRVLDAGILARDGEWARAFVSFVYQGETSPLYWYVGLAPDSRFIKGTSASFAGFQLEQSATPTPYNPGTATRGLGLSVARIPYWRAAWQGFLDKPLFGWGQEQFPDYYRDNGASRRQIQAIPSHAHNLFLQLLFERGIIGLAGLLLLLIALSHQALKKRDAAFLTVFAAILFANFFDYTLFYGGVIYPLAAVAGWRAASYQKARTHEETTVKQLGVRLALSTIDFLMALGSLALAVWVAQLLGKDVAWQTLPNTLFYALLLWPAMAWREGLYPGYGLTAPQELKKQVVGAAYGGLVLAAGTVLFYRDLPLPRSVLLLTVLLSMLLAPVGRALIKRLLLGLGLWGRPVVILGAGKAGKRVAKALLRRPLDGLTPVAFFDDDVEKHQQSYDGVMVMGTLDGADHYAQSYGVQHAIVAIPTASTERLAALVNYRGRVFRRVQFVPDLTALPSQGIYASDLDGMLALEVRNELGSRSNRIFKRTIDILAVLTGGLIISPLLVLLCIAIYIDSPGPLFFGHRRLGRDGRYFKTWKFRSMVPNAQEVLVEYLTKHPELRQEWEETYKLQDDPRITRVGRFLRKYSLDELPQLWNVLVGEMSLVGPRPIVDEEVSKYDKAFELYKMVRPGMTGYWQVSGRSDTSYTYRVELDSFYVRNWSVWLDIVILIDTLNVVVKGDGAY